MFFRPNSMRKNIIIFPVVIFFFEISSHSNSCCRKFDCRESNNKQSVTYKSFSSRNLMFFKIKESTVDIEKSESLSLFRFLMLLCLTHLFLQFNIIKTFLWNYFIGARIKSFIFRKSFFAIFQFSRHAWKNFRSKQIHNCASLERTNSPLQKRRLPLVQIILFYSLWKKTICDATCASKYLWEENNGRHLCGRSFSIWEQKIIQARPNVPTWEDEFPWHKQKLHQPTRLAELND